MEKKILTRSFYQRDTVIVAQDLLGKLIVRVHGGTRVSGIITETEAYTVDDPASHAFIGQTARNSAMFGPVGHAYIYFIYGNHYCLNMVARTPGIAAGGVLIRALKPVQGIDIMRERRKRPDDHHLTDGPGKVGQALAISKQLYGTDLTIQGPLYVTEGIAVNPVDIISSPRVGIKKGIDLLWRFQI